ncbi:MAG TPA: type II toxin-antitoxin system HicA family toxin [Planctomycetota bacterium]
MSRLRRLSGRELCGILQDHGFVLVRQRGSHVVMQRREVATTITVPVQITRSSKRGPSSQSFASHRSHARSSRPSSTTSSVSTGER